MCVVLIGVSVANFLLFHVLAEAFAVFVAVLMLATAWHTYPHSRDAFLMFLGCGYFWIGMTDLVHALAYKGMDIFAGGSANPATQYWLGARVMEAAVLLAAPWFLDRTLRRGRTFIAFGIAFVGVCALVATGWFPTAYVDGVGLTAFKIGAEYAIVAMLLLALVHMHYRSDRLTRENFHKMMASIVLTIVAELCFTLYIGVYGPVNVAGHLFKLCSFWIIFDAIIRTTLEEPYARLEQLVDERTSELKEREGRLRLAIEAAALGEVDIDYTKGTVAASPRFSEILGLTGREPKTVEEVHARYHPEDRDRIVQQVDDTLASGHSRLNMEFRVVRPDGTVAWVELLGGRVEYDNGETLRAIAIIQDITGRKRAIEALRHSEERFRQFAENIQAVVWIADSHTRRLEYLSASYESVFGEPPDRIQADIDRWIDLVHPKDRQRLRRAMRRLGAQKSYEVEFRIIRPLDGAIRWIRDTGFSVPDETGVVRRFAGIARDVTAWKEAGEALRESEEMFRALFRWSPVAIAISRMDDGRVVDANDAWLTMMGYERSQTVGRTAEELGVWAGSSQPADRLADGEPLAGTQEIARRKDGTPIILLSFHQQITFKGMPHAVSIALDITERTEAEQRQRVLMREVDHRAKNALAVVQALVRLTKADTVEAFIGAVQGRVAALAQAHSLLAKNRWNGADLRSLIEAEMKPYLGDLTARSCLSGPAVSLAAEAVQPLGMVFHELATNAAKYGSLSVPQGTVELTWTQRADGELRLVWQEAGGPPVREPTRHGFGSKMIVATVVDQLDGAVEFLWREEGMACHITVAGSRVGQDSRQGDETSDLSPAMDAVEPPPDLDRHRALVSVNDER
jgi:PAS domain S-box-containing protein